MTRVIILLYLLLCVGCVGERITEEQCNSIPYAQWVTKLKPLLECQEGNKTVIKYDGRPCGYMSAGGYCFDTLTGKFIESMEQVNE